MRFTRNTGRFFKLLVSGALLLSLCACTRAPEKQERTLFAMDTYIILTAYGENASAGLDAAAGTVNAMNALLEPETEGSAVFRLNHGETVQNLDIVSMMQTAKRVYDGTGGALDLTVYPLVRSWGFIGAEYRVPEEREISALLENTDFSRVTVKSAGVSVPEGMALSFGAVAKGYTADRAAEAMEAAGVTSGILSLGGNVRTVGEKPGGGKWQVAVQDPADTGASVGTLSLSGETSAVTSGGYQRFFEQDGVTYHHILDPHTGYPAESGLKGVTVVCEDGALADALSTALFVLGETEALRLQSEAGGFEALLITSDGRIVLTPGLAGCFAPNENSGYTVETAG